MSEGDGAYVAVIDQDKVTDEVKQIAVNYCPVNRSGGEGFYVNDDGELHIDDANVLEAHKIIENKIGSDAVRIIPLASKTGQLIHQYGKNGFSLHGIPVPLFDDVVGLIGENGIGKSTALSIIAGEKQPNFGDDEASGFQELAQRYKGTEAQAFFTALADEEINVALKPQHVDVIPDAYDGTVKALLQRVDERDAYDTVIDGLSLGHVESGNIDDLSGGELQRVAIAATVVKDADLYLFDEPTSYLDIKQRVEVSAFIRSLADEDHAVMVIEHDLIILDYLTDLVNVVYGESGAYGVVSMAETTKKGINTYLDGYLAEENVQFRKSSIEFEERSEKRYTKPDVITSWPAFTHEYDTFSLEAGTGTIYEDDIIGVLGENGIGKSTLMEVLSGEIAKDFDMDEVTMSHKPQHLDADDTLVRLYLDGAKQHKHTVIDPLSIEPLLDKTLADLSGGELQRVKIARCLIDDADVYLLDEPSAYLDVEQRLAVSNVIRDVMSNRGAAAVVIDHDLLFIDYIATRLLVFDGEPGVHGEANGPMSMADGMNMFLEDVGITFRRDPQNNRPRINKDGSQKDKEQKRNGQYYYT